MVDLDKSSDDLREPAEDDRILLSIKQIFVKDISFEVPLGGEVHSKKWQPKINQDIATEVHKLADDRYEVTLKVTVSVKEEKEVLFFVEIEQIGIFQITGTNTRKKTEVLHTKCPEILFPYVRELIDNLVVRGAFSALRLPPVNFDALFQEALAIESQGRAEKLPPETIN